MLTGRLSEGRGHRGHELEIRPSFLHKWYFRRTVCSVNLWNDTGLSAYFNSSFFRASNVVLICLPASFRIPCSAMVRRLIYLVIYLVRPHQDRKNSRSSEVLRLGGLSPSMKPIFLFLHFPFCFWSHLSSHSQWHPHRVCSTDRSLDRKRNICLARSARYLYESQSAFGMQLDLQY